MSPRAEPSPYHHERPLPHDLAYHLEEGFPVLDRQKQEEEDG